MRKSPSIRMATDGDAPAIAAIDGPFCESSVVSFEYVPPSAREMAERVRQISAQYPWLVMEDDEVIGYAYASRHHERAAYAWSANTAVYISPAHHRRGVGRALYTALLALLRLQGYFKAYAGVTLPNPGSTGLHLAMGYEPVGVYRGVGYKRGAWHDVAYFQLVLQPERPDPQPPVSAASLIGSPGWHDTLSTGLRHYHPPLAPDTKEI